MKYSAAVRFEHERIKEELRDKFIAAFPDTSRSLLEEIIESAFTKAINLTRNVYFRHGLDHEQAEHLLRRLENN